MKRLSLSLAVVILALSSAVSASDFEEDKQYISCRNLNFSGLLTLKSVTPTLTLAF